MEKLGSSFEIDGVTVRADHEDPDQFWYHAARVSLDKRPDGSDAITMLKYKPATAAAGVKGGGYLMLQTVVVLPDETRDRIMARIAALSPTGSPRLAPVPIEKGTVRCVALNLEGGGTTATPPPPGAFNAVTQILGTTTPSMSAQQTAVFSLVLDQEGATILQKAFESGTAPVAVIYTLEHSALSPDLHVKITADFERIYRHFSASVEAQIYWVRAGIDAGFEKLVQDGAIKIEVIDFTGAEDREAKEKWALDFFKNDLLAKWFEPSLDLGQLKGPAQPKGLDAIIDGFKKVLPATPTGGMPGTPATPTGGMPGTPATTTGSMPGAPAKPAGTTTTPTTPTDGKPALVSFRLKFVRQEERKTLEVVYDRKKAVKQQHNPQGFIGLLLNELPDKSKHFVEIDLDDPFFRVLGVHIATPADFARIGLFSTDVSIDYGDPADAQNHRHQEFRLTAADPGPKRFETFLNANHEIEFRAGVQHHFDANSGWIGEKLSYEIPPQTTTDRTLNVDPGNHLGFLELQIFPNRIDAGIVEAIDVALSYDDGATFQRGDQFRVTAASAPQFWRLRLTRRERREWSARFTHHLKNGGTRTSGPITSDAGFLPVDDPFDGALNIRAIPLFAPGAVRRAFLDITYIDEANGYRREERLDIPGTATEPVALRIALVDPALRTFRHQVTVVTGDGRLIQNEPVDGTQTLIGVGQGL